MGDHRRRIRRRVGVEAALRAAFGARPVVGEQHDDRVRGGAHLVQDVEEPPDLGVGVTDEAGVDLHHAGEHLALRSRQCRPVRDARVALPELGPRREDPQPDLAFEDLNAFLVPAVIEGAAVALDPLAGRLVGRVARAEAEIQEERLRGRETAQVADLGDRLIDEVLAEVIAGTVGHRQRERRVVAGGSGRYWSVAPARNP